jgi:hypothetical protein
MYVAATILIAVPPFLIHSSGYRYVLVPKFEVFFFFFSALTFMICLAGVLSARKNSSLSAQVFLIATSVKIMLCMGLALAYLLKNHVNNVHFLLCFFYLYLLNTVFEVYTLLSNLRNQNLK